MKRSFSASKSGKAGKPKTEICDTWHDEYEIKQPMMPGSPLKSVFGIHYNYVTNKVGDYYHDFNKDKPKTSSTEIKLVSKLDFETRPIEYYAHCLSREHQLNKSIFVDKDYLSHGICYYAFLISREANSSVDMIVFLDNYETEGPSDFQVRFIWGYPRKFLDSAQDTLEDIRDEIEKYITVSQFDTVSVINRSYIRPFIKTPIVTPLSQQIFKSSCFSEESNKIQLPILKPSDWQSFPRVTCADKSLFSNPQYLCLLASGKLSPEVDKVVKLYAGYLKREEGYDFSPYKESAFSEIYLVMRSDLKLCVGIFIFEKQKNDLSVLRREIKESYELYQAEKKFTSENEKEYLSAKLARNEDKFKNAYASKTDYKKYQDKIDNLACIKFFSCSKNKWPDTSKVAMLKCAWIHPYHRGQKILTQLWPAFQEKYGVFDIDYPSENMKSFIEKRSISNIPFRTYTLVT